MAGTEDRRGGTMRRSLFLAAAAGLLLAACGERLAGGRAAPLSGEAALGPADARATVIEYGAPTCPACKMWHDAVWPGLKRDYVDTGRIRFVFRTLPSHNPPVDAAIAGIARCAGAEGFFKVIDQAFRDQALIEAAAQRGDARSVLTALGRDHGLSAEAVEACVNDPAHLDAVIATQKDAAAARVPGTPTFFINGVMMNDHSEVAMKTAIDAALAAPPETARETPPETPSGAASGTPAEAGDADPR